MVQTGYLKTIKKEIDEEFSIGFEQNPGQYVQFCEVETIPNNTRTSAKLQGRSYGGIAPLQKVTQLREVYQEAQIMEGFEYSFEFDTYGQQVVIDEETDEDAISDLDGILDVAKAQGIAAQRTIDMVVFDTIFNNGKTTMGPDGKAIFATDHPIKDNQYSSLNGGATTWGNLLTAKPFSFDNFDEAVYTLESKQYALDGYPLTAKASIIVGPKALDNVFKQCLNSTRIYDNADNAEQQYSNIKPITSNLLTTNATRSLSTYYILGQKGVDYKIFVIFRRKPRMRTWWDDNKRTWKYACDLRFTCGIKTPYGMLRVEGV